MHLPPGVSFHRVLIQIDDTKHIITFHLKLELRVFVIVSTSGNQFVIGTRLAYCGLLNKVAAKAMSAT